MIPNVFWVCIIVRTLRRLLYRLIWQDCDISNLPFVQQDILRVTSRLFNQIHVRNSRRHFCDEENWLWPALPKTELVPAALESAGTFDYSDSMSYSSSRRARIVLSCIPQVVCFDRRAEVFSQYCPRIGLEIGCSTTRSGLGVAFEEIGSLRTVFVPLPVSQAVPVGTWR